MNKFFILLFFILITFLPVKALEIDEIADRLDINVSKPEVYTKYNYESTIKIPVKLRVLKAIYSENDVYENQIIMFRTTKNVIHNGELLIPRSTIITAKINTIITSGMNGIPASIILSDFSSRNIESGKFSNSYEIFGQDRSLFVFPLKRT